MNAKAYKTITICVAVLLVAALAVTLGIFVYREQKYSREIGALYDAAYYSCVDNLGDMDNKLAKLDAASSDTMRKELLNGIYTDSKVMATSLAMLAGKNDEIEAAMKFVNQLGDYAYYLASKLPAEAMTAEEKEKLDELKAITLKLEEAFLNAGDKVAEGGNLYAALGAEVTALGEVYDLFTEGNVEYPEMIYDGPFSDGLRDREAKFLAGKPEISREAAEAGLTLKYGEGFEYQGTVEGSLRAYSYTLSNGANVQITVTGGMLAEYSYYRETGAATMDEEAAAAAATQALAEAGYDGMQAVWVSVKDNTAYINCAYVENDIIYYPDLVKVKVALDDGEILGISAANYLYNHTAREAIGEVKPSDGVELAEGFVTSSVRLTVIPTDWNTELTAYEFAGSIGDNVYYVYYDAYTLEQIKVMRVIKDGNEGNLIV